MTKELYNTKRSELIDKAQNLINDGKVDEANEIYNEVVKLDNAYEEACKIQANFNALNNANPSKTIQTIIGGTKMENNIEQTMADKLNSVEYRNAFMANVLKGTAIPQEFRNQNGQTTTGDVASVIPTVLIQKIYSKLENVGKFFGMATKTNYKGGVTVPVSAVNLTASWVAERGTSETQEAPTTSISFVYRKLICKVAISFETSIVTLDIFEADFVEKVSKAMIKAIEQSMFTGNGSNGNQFIGFLTEIPANGQAIEIVEGNHITYADLCNAEGALPEAYDMDAIWVMQKKTFFSEIVGMVDNDGQPVARVNVGIDGKPEYLILGRRVEFAPYMSAFSTSVESDTIVAAIFDFNAYVINTNYAMTVKRYTDEDTDDQITKAIMLVDGKAVDTNSLVTVTIKN